MTSKFLRLGLPVCAIAVAIGAVAVSGASASENEQSERAACVVTAANGGSNPVTLSDTELRSKLEAAGYSQVRSIGHEGGCVEAKGLDKDGKRFEVYLHPTTGEIVSQR